MAGTIRATTANGDIVFNARTGFVVKGTYRGIEGIERINALATAKNLKCTVDELRNMGCKLVYCTFYLKSGKRHDGVPYPYEVKDK